MKYLFSIIAIFTLSFTFAQPDSAEFPDFTYQDLDGNEQNLYSYLDEGKIVIIDVFTTWCPNCINSLPTLEDIWQEHGPNGDDSVMIFSFERDSNTSNEEEFVMDHNITNPVITGAEDVIADLWNVPYQPYYFVICPDRSFQLQIGAINNNPDILTDLSADCTEDVSIDEIRETGDKKIIQSIEMDQIILNSYYQSEYNYTIYDLNGRLMSGSKENSQSNQISISSLATGMYILVIEYDGAFLSDRFVKEE